MPSLFGGGGASTQPAAQPVSTAQGQFQSYTPQAQQQQDYTWQGLQNQLANLGWTGLKSLPGGMTPTTALYPQVGNIAGAMTAGDPNVAGAYGSYGGLATGTALQNAQQYQSLFQTPNTLANYGIQTGQAGLNQLDAIINAGFNPQIGQTVQNIVTDPYFTQALQGAQTGAGYGATAAGQAAGAGGTLNQLASGLPAIGQQAAATTGAQIPLVQGLAAGSAGLAPQLSGQAAGLSPQFAGIGQLGTGLAAAAPGLAQQAQATTPLAQTVQGMGTGLAAAAPGFAGGALADVAPLAGVSSDLLRTGFDPQSALYNRTTQQVMDQQQAINAMSGVGTSPYGAGVAGQTMANFNIDWQNQQLQRQAQAAAAASGVAGQQLAGTQAGANILNQLTQGGGTLALGGAAQQAANLQQQANILQNLTQVGGNLALGGGTGQLSALTGAGNIYNQLAQGAGGLATTAGGLSNQSLNAMLNAYQGAGGLYQTGLGLGQGATGLAAGAAGLPGNVFQQQQQAALQALQAQNQAAGLGVQNLAGLTSQLGVAGQQPITGLNALTTMAQQPYNFAQAQQANALNALNQQATFGNQMLQLPQNVLANAQAYMTGGQNASQIGGLLGQQAFNQNQQQLSGIGNLLGGLTGGAGTAAGGNLLFGSQGLGGALGLNPQTGLFGAVKSGLGSLFGGAAAAAPGAAALAADPFLSAMFV